MSEAPLYPRKCDVSVNVGPIHNLKNLHGCLAQKKTPPPRMTLGLGLR